MCVRDAVPRKAHSTSKGPQGTELSVSQKPSAVWSTGVGELGTRAGQGRAGQGAMLRQVCDGRQEFSHGGSCKPR